MQEFEDFTMAKEYVQKAYHTTQRAADSFISHATQGQTMGNGYNNYKFGVNIMTSGLGIAGVASAVTAVGSDAVHLAQTTAAKVQYASAMADANNYLRDCGYTQQFSTKADNAAKTLRQMDELYNQSSFRESMHYFDTATKSAATRDDAIRIFGKMSPSYPQTEDYRDAMAQMSQRGGHDFSPKDFNEACMQNELNFMRKERGLDMSNEKYRAINEAIEECAKSVANERNFKMMEKVSAAQGIAKKAQAKNYKHQSFKTTRIAERGVKGTLRNAKQLIKRTGKNSDAEDGLETIVGAITKTGRAVQTVARSTQRSARHKSKTSKTKLSKLDKKISKLDKKINKKLSVGKSDAKASRKLRRLKRRRKRKGRLHAIRFEKRRLIKTGAKVTFKTAGAGVKFTGNAFLHVGSAAGGAIGHAIGKTRPVQYVNRAIAKNVRKAKLMAKRKQSRMIRRLSRTKVGRAAARARRIATRFRMLQRRAMMPFKVVGRAMNNVFYFFKRMLEIMLKPFVLLFQTVTMIVSSIAAAIFPTILIIAGLIVVVVLIGRISEYREGVSSNIRDYSATIPAELATSYGSVTTNLDKLGKDLVQSHGLNDEQAAALVLFYHDVTCGNPFFVGEGTDKGKHCQYRGIFNLPEEYYKLYEEYRNANCNSGAVDASGKANDFITQYEWQCHFLATHLSEDYLFGGEILNTLNAIDSNAAYEYPQERVEAYYQAFRSAYTFKDSDCNYAYNDSFHIGDFEAYCEDFDVYEEPYEEPTTVAPTTQTAVASTN